MAGASLGKHSALSGVLLGGTLGALIGHRLSADESASSRVQPLLAVSPRSAALGLGGRF